IGHKGAVRAEIVVKGKTAHASTPWLGVNAFQHMVYVAKAFFEELVPRVESRRSKYRFDMPGGERATMMLGGVVRGGGKINQVPGEASFTIDRRVIPEEKAEEAWREIVEFVDQLRTKGYDVEARLLGMSDAVVTDPDNILVKAMSASIRAVAGIEPEATVCIGGLDLRYYVTAGCTGISYGPGVPNTAHAPDENIVLDDIFTVAKAYTMLPAMLAEK
ncbi:MAG: M20/M25/M40 family metallo-hydrolase, partial [Candidatus Korarchaeota archaeon]|nr:M20/M25/M40 family metallo-hydrolase [Candidatus Korarchaeota archaeon]